ncbi:TIGR03620 family F420-dependent LLM class oxidoreductase [Kibdelosporangium philippinense]|uniref:TIGR03620 family F420-dependent LLM class oxidoreductase n=1 Tax=Kibdelosporangium philippinense TaxID=211113 RepID=A0ABS8ZUF5_9PSEU|nr:TIGR03620 family F420-dependent LLM class oxidoreductase [Kibdelosporangium philippinense]MCE7011327.1 TIGR03620 family F420-dependent LLM class oxidoreductase [Kibdelosporangium philippinense]
MTHDLGRLGIWTFAFDPHPAAVVRDAAAELDDLGFGAIWFGEAFGRDAVSQAALLLDATKRLVVATGIANIHLRDPIATAAAERSLGEQYPGRFVLGLGGHRVPGSRLDAAGYRIPFSGKPVSGMRDYLANLDKVPLNSASAERPRRVLAALGPRMLDLAAELTWGAHPYFVPVEHTVMARERMGPAAFLAVEQAVFLGGNEELKREHVGAYVAGAPHHRANLLRLGFDETDFEGGGSDRLVDALVVGGSLEAIAKRVDEHLAAGADHVCLQVLTAEKGVMPLREWRELAVLT